jgi:hypothetical protein
MQEVTNSSKLYHNDGADDNRMTMTKMMKVKIIGMTPKLILLTICSVSAGLLIDPFFLYHSFVTRN